jgi:hypothetical protein
MNEEPRVNAAMFGLLATPAAQGVEAEGLIPVSVLEIVQARGETVTRTRETVQDTSKLARTYYLPGETMKQKLYSLQGYIASTREPEQLVLLAYIEDILQAPQLLETVAVDNDLNLAEIEYLVEEIEQARELTEEPADESVLSHLAALGEIGTFR